MDRLPSGTIILPVSPPANEATGNVRIVNGVVQTGLNVARYEDGTTIAGKPLRMRGTVTDAMIVGGSAVLAVDAESRTFVNVLDVATATRSEERRVGKECRSRWSPYH